MNWLMYIGGGWFWLGGWLWKTNAMVDKSALSEEDKGPIRIMTILCSISVWIWICWKFIK